MANMSDVMYMLTCVTIDNMCFDYWQDQAYIIIFSYDYKLNHHIMLSLLFSYGIPLKHESNWPSMLLRGEKGMDYMLGIC